MMVKLDGLVLSGLNTNQDKSFLAEINNFKADQESLLGTFSSMMSYWVAFTDSRVFIAMLNNDGSYRFQYNVLFYSRITSLELATNEVSENPGRIGIRFEDVGVITFEFNQTCHTKEIVMAIANSTITQR